MRLGRPVLCLVTDRRRLAARAGLAPEGPEILEALVAIARQAASAGVDLIQVREPDLGAGDLSVLVKRVMAATDGTGSRVVVNDRLDVALATGAGVHLPERSLPVERVRDLVESRVLVGRSVHDARGAAEAGAASYVIFGTVFETRSKPPGHPVAGIAGLTEAVVRSPVPVLAIGGVSRASLPQVAACGAAGVAAVDLFLPPTGGSAADWLHEIVADAREAFDSDGRVS
jgi:thiamine-phosphate pyrophosphorylase